jgi:two-component system, LytTR family, sensor kinase
LPASTSNIKKNRRFFGAGVLLLIAIQVKVLRSVGINWQQALGDSAISAVCLATACLVVSNNLRFYLPRRYQYPILIAWSVALSGVYALVSQWLLKLAFRSDPDYMHMLESSLTIR